MTKHKVTMELLERAIAREPNAVYQFVQILEPVLRGRIGRVLLASRSVCRDEVKDRCQDILVQLLIEDDGRYLRSWNPKGKRSFENYVGAKAEWLTKDYLRRGKEVFLHDDEPSEIWEPAVDSSRSPERIVEARDLAAKLFVEMKAELSDDGCRMFQLLFIEQLPVSEVAAMMATTEDAVYQRHSRLKRRMQEIAAAMGVVA